MNDVAAGEDFFFEYQMTLSALWYYENDIHNGGWLFFIMHFSSLDMFNQIYIIMYKKEEMKNLRTGMHDIQHPPIVKILCDLGTIKIKLLNPRSKLTS